MFPMEYPARHQHGGIFSKFQHPLSAEEWAKLPGTGLPGCTMMMRMMGGVSCLSSPPISSLPQYNYAYMEDTNHWGREEGN